jgi:DNA excision repair protein ERCC-2
VFKSWWDEGLIEEIMRSKLMFLETERPEETSVALENYRRAIECGRGAVFLGVARGRVSEGIDFADHYGRCVLLFGLPVRNTVSMLVQTRAEFVETSYGIDKNDFILFDAMRAACQCVGRLLRSKNDYGIVVMADRRYSRPNASSQMPHWIKQFVTDARVGVSIDEAVEQTRHFLVQMAQPFKHDPDRLIDMGQR